MLKGGEVFGKCATMWMTYDGRFVKLEDLDHSHLTNSYWYLRIFSGIIPTNIVEVLEKKYNGELLDYTPRIREEKEYLEKSGMVMIGIGGCKNIMFEGKKIGYIK